MNSEMKERMNEIRNIENKYGLVTFRCGLSHLIDVGHRNLTDTFVEETIKKIIADGEKDEANGVIQIMSPGFQCEILRCAADIARYSIWTLVVYIKKYVEVSGL